MEKIFEIPIAHRGLHGEGIPENSMSAFSAAIEAGFAIETDVHFTADRQLALFHDDTLLRMTGDNRRISDCTMSELSALFLGDTRERIPTLTDLLTLCAGKVPILLEIKNQSGGNAKEFLRAISSAFEGYGGEYAVQSFQPLYVREYKKLCPEVLCGLLTDSNPSLDDFSPPLKHLKRRIVSHMSLNAWVKPDFISFSFQSPSKKMLAFRGKKLCWTVRSEQDEAIARRVADNIIFEHFIPGL